MAKLNFALLILTKLSRVKFGLLDDISGVDFTLPPDPRGTKLLLHHLPERQGLPKLYVGATGWSNKEWIGSVYPKGSKPGEFLKFYTRAFNTIELNTTHYRIPSSEMTEKWHRLAPPDFRYCPKVPQMISHRTSMAVGEERVEWFLRSVRELGDRHGCSFVQLPPYFGYDRMAVLERFLAEAWDDALPLAVEVRHPSWFENYDRMRDLFALLERYDKTAVITDVAGRRDVLHMRLTTNRAMVRWVGYGLHPTDYERLTAWAERLAHWYEQGLQEVYFFPHQPDDALVPETAQFFLEQVRQRVEVDTRGPEPPQGDAAGQLGLFG